MKTIYQKEKNLSKSIMFLSGWIRKKIQKIWNYLLGDLSHIKFLLESGMKGIYREWQTTKRSKASGQSEILCTQGKKPR